MASFIDARIPILFGATPQAGDHVLAVDTAWALAHPVGCACCGARSAAALALDRLFLDRVKGNMAWFERVVVPVEDAALRRALTDDALVSSRFRAADPSPPQP